MQSIEDWIACSPTSIFYKNLGDHGARLETLEKKMSA
jgi:hypothetical protein